jgi:WD40 repeat protein
VKRILPLLLCLSVAGCGGAPTSAQAPHSFGGPPPVMPTMYVLGMAFSPDGKRLLTNYALDGGGVARTQYLTLWDLDSGAPVWSLSPPRKGAEPVSGWAFLPGGKQALISADRAPIAVWDMEAGRPVRSFLDGGNDRGLSLTPDGKSVFAVAADDRLVRYDIPTGRVADIFYNTTTPLHGYALSPDMKLLLTESRPVQGAEDTMLWDLTKGTPLHTFPRKEGWGAPLAFSPDGKLAVVGRMTWKEDTTAPGGGHRQTALVFWDVLAGKALREFELEGWASARFLRDAKSLFVVNDRGDRQQFGRFDVASGQLLWQKPPPGSGLDFALSPDGTRVAWACGTYVMGSGQGITIELWDLGEGTRLKTIEVPQRY